MQKITTVVLALTLLSTCFSINTVIIGQDIIYENSVNINDLKEINSQDLSRQNINQNKNCQWKKISDTYIKTLSEEDGGINGNKDYRLYRNIYNDFVGMTSYPDFRIKCIQEFFSKIIAPTIKNQNTKDISGSINSPLTFDYVTRDPIRIYGDVNFTSENGVIGGTGTTDDPYIIEGWEINRIETAIEISGTRSHFVLRNCFVNISKGGYFESIILSNVENGTISNLVCDSPHNPGVSIGQDRTGQGSSNIKIKDTQIYAGQGIIIGKSKNVSVENCSIRYYFEGVYVGSSTSVISNSIMTSDGNSSGSRGIIIPEQSHKNIIESCDISESTTGILIRSSSNQVLKNNSLHDNKQNLVVSTIFEGSLDHFYHDIDTSNTVEGKPVYYLRNKSNIVLDGDEQEIGLIALIECENVSIKNHNMMHSRIVLAGTHNSSITKVSLSGYYSCIELFKSSNNFIKNCDMKDGGILLCQSPHNTLRNNKLVSSSNKILDMGSEGLFEVYRVSLEDSVQDIDESNTIDGKPIYYLVGEKNKRISAQKVGYLGLVNCKDIEISNMVLANKAQGIMLVNTTKTTIKGNIFLGNVMGIDLYESSYIEIINCIFMLNMYCAIWCDYSSNITIDRCRVIFNGGGFNIENSNGNEIKRCKTIFNSFQTIRLVNCSDNRFFANKLQGGGSFTGGIFISGYGFTNEIDPNKVSSGNEICYNQIRYFNTAIDLTDYSNGNEVHHNDIKYNSLQGIELWLSNNNSIHHNNIERNGGFGEKAYGIWSSKGSGNKANYNNICNNAIGILVAHQTMDITNNWWGSKDGPGGYGTGTGDVLDTHNATVYYQPWLNDPVKIITSPYVAMLYSNFSNFKEGERY